MGKQTRRKSRQNRSFRIIWYGFPGISRRIKPDFPGFSAKMAKSKKPAPERKEPLDKVSGKRGKGRPQHIARSWVTGRAHNYRKMFAEMWPRLGASLLAANTDEEVISAFGNHGHPYTTNFVPSQTSDILALIHDPDFPKRTRARIAFLADSLAGRPNVAFRTSRDLCGKDRAKERAKSPHKIIRKEFYIECSCGYRGPARDNACRKCGATIPLDLEIMWASPGLFR